MFKNVLNELCKIYRETTFSDETLFVVQDVCGPVYLWPQYIKKILLSKTMCYNERLKLTTFLYVNGLRDPERWLHFVICIKGVGFRRYEREFNDLFTYYGREEVQRRYFSYCVRHKMYEYLDGSPRSRGE